MSFYPAPKIDSCTSASLLKITWPRHRTSDFVRVTIVLYLALIFIFLVLLFSVSYHFLSSQFFTLNLYYGYYGYSDGYNITSNLSVIFNEKIRRFNPSGLAESRIQEILLSRNISTWFTNRSGFSSLCMLNFGLLSVVIETSRS